MHKESQHPAVDPKTSSWASKRTRKTQRDGHNSGVKIWSLCSVSTSTLSHATLEQPFRTLAIKWEVNIFLKKSSCVVPSCVLHYCVCYHCVGMYPVFICMQQCYKNQFSLNRCTFFQERMFQPFFILHYCKHSCKCPERKNFHPLRCC